MSETTQMSGMEINKEAIIMTHTHQTARTQFIDANGIRCAYRRFSNTGGLPQSESHELLCLSHRRARKAAKIPNQTAYAAPRYQMSKERRRFS